MLVISSLEMIAQPAPAGDENIPYLVTFGGNAEKSWGDDDFTQVFFCKIPKAHKEAVYIRVYDPDTGGEIDEPKGTFNTRISFTVFGGPGTWSTEDARKIEPVGNYRSGILLDTRSFEAEAQYDQQWYTFGPFNPQEGEWSDRLDGYIFKIIAEGISGNDGNLYRYFMSSDKEENREIEGANIFTYEYSFRLSNNQDNVSKIYPFIDDRTISVKVMNFDWDNDGMIQVISVAKMGSFCTISGDNDWATNDFPVIEAEKNTSMEIRFIKNKDALVRNNNVVMVVQNQYGESLPFYVIPIGGIPVYNPKLQMKTIQR
jgi:hypothetical protein